MARSKQQIIDGLRYEVKALTDRIIDLEKELKAKDEFIRKNLEYWENIDCECDSYCGHTCSKHRHIREHEQALMKGQANGKDGV